MHPMQPLPTGLPQKHSKWHDVYTLDQLSCASPLGSDAIEYCSFAGVKVEMSPVGWQVILCNPIMACEFP